MSMNRKVESDDITDMWLSDEIGCKQFDNHMTYLGTTKQTPHTSNSGPKKARETF